MLTTLTSSVNSVHTMKTVLSPRSGRPLAERLAFVSGGVALLACAAHLLAFALVDDAVWAGPIGFRKPAMFGFSVGVTLLSLAWLVRAFPPRRLQAALLGVMSGALLLEVVIIALQRFRGVPSHFNMATLLDGVLWSMMGFAITIFALLAIVQAVWSFGRLHAPPAMKTAIRAAMVLLVFSQVSGQLIVLNGTSVVMPGGEFVAANIAQAATFGAAGNLKLPHAIALHGLQVLPLLGLLVVRLRWTAGVAHFWIAFSGLGFLGLALTAQVQAYTGRAVLDFGPLVGVAFLLSLAAFGLPWLLAANSWLRGELPRRRPLTSPAAAPSLEVH